MSQQHNWMRTWRCREKSKCGCVSSQHYFLDANARLDYAREYGPKNQVGDGCRDEPTISEKCPCVDQTSANEMLTANHLPWSEQSCRRILASLHDMIIHLIDGTYELFRHFYGLRRGSPKGTPFGAVAGVLGTVIQMLEGGATHIGVATDHIIESFRND